MSFTLNLNTAATTVIPPTSSGAPRTLLTSLPEPGHFLLVLDNTAAESFTTCPRLGQYRLVDRREAHARNAALVFGGAIHEGLEGLLLGEPPATQDQRILKFFTENPAPPDEYRTVQNALTVLDRYRTRATFPDYEWEIMSDEHGLIVERAFELPLGVLEVNSLINAAAFGLARDVPPIFVKQIHVAWSGRIDVVARCNNAVRVVDHKTTSIAGDQFVQDFQLSNQTIGYVWAAQQLWPQHNPNGFCLNAIHFKKPTGSGPIDQAGPRGGAAALNFFRAYYDYSPSRLAEWSDNALTLVEDFVHCLVRNYFPMHTKWCFGKYGKCQYHDVCTVDDLAVRQRMLLSDMFKDVTWNPVAGR